MRARPRESAEQLRAKYTALQEQHEQLRADHQRLLGALAAAPSAAGFAPYQQPIWFDTVSDAIFLVDPAWRITDWNAAAEQIYGWPRAAVVGQPFAQVVPVVRYVDGDTNASALHMLSTVGAWRGACVQRTRDGREITVAASSHRLHDAQGATSGFITINRDISAWVEAEAALQASEERFRAIIEHCAQGIMLIGADRRPRYISATVTALLGYPAAALADLRVSELSHPDDLPQIEGFVAALLGGSGASAQATVRLRHQGGSWRWMELRGIDQTSNPAIAALIISLHDVTERVVAQQELVAGHQRVVRLKNEFLASMSHELRTPLNAILGRAEALDEGVYGALADRQRAAVDGIAASGRHLLALINDILDLAKIEAGKLVLDREPLAIDDLCHASMQLIAQAAATKQIQLSSTIDSLVDTIDADVRRLKQILLNLLSNAVKFTARGGQVGLEVRGDAERQQVTFTIWDTGIGIAAEDQAQLFQPFVQIDSRLSRDYEGSGLGLALVRRLAEAHGGSVSVESALGQGSRFCVVLPWAPAVLLADRSPAPAAAPEPARHRDPAARPLVLLAEDNELNSAMLQDYLQIHGYRVAVASDGREALECARALAPDLILMDIQMPRMDGLEVTRQLRADARLRLTPIVALTALAMPGDRQRCIEAGASGYLTKPVSLHGLLSTIADLLAKAAAPV